MPADSDHERALVWLSKNSELLVTTDFVIDETLTLLRVRGETKLALDMGGRFFSGELTDIYYISDEDFRAAWDVFKQFADKGWSFTDCTSKVVMQQLGIEVAFAFDRHYRQIGAVSVVPAI